MGVSQWLPGLKAVTEQRDFERSLEREAEERARAFLGMAEYHLVHFPNYVASARNTEVALEDAAREGLSQAKAKSFIEAVSKGLDESAVNVVEGQSSKLDETAETVAKQIQSLELPADKFMAAVTAIAPVIVGLVSQHLQDSQKLPSSTAGAVLHVALQSLRAALSKPEYLKADAHLKAVQRADRPT